MPMHPTGPARKGVGTLSLANTIQDADWKKEKHVPVIEVPESVTAGEPAAIAVSVGKEIPHPNTPEHHISWMKLYFHPEGGGFPVEIGDYRMLAHGEAGEVSAEPAIEARVTFGKPGMLQALSYCNLHGLWQSEVQLTL